MQVRLPNRRDKEDEPKKTTGGRNRERRVSGKRRRTIRGRGSKLGGEEGEESQEEDEKQPNRKRRHQRNKQKENGIGKQRIRRQRELVRERGRSQGSRKEDVKEIERGKKKRWRRQEQGQVKKI